MDRKIIHIDMDAFYPSVEMLDQPQLQGRAVIVGGRPQSRGVVASANYEARKHGVRSAMAAAVAYKRCPQAVFLSPRIGRYREISQQIHAIFQQYTELIEPVSLDEAWLDVTQNFQRNPSATWIAQSIKQQIFEELHLNCSAGVSFNKFLAKVASEEDKPDGLYVIPPETAQQFLLRMEVRKIPGVGKVTQTKLKNLGVEYGRQLYAQPEALLIKHFGKMGTYLYHIIRGDDRRPVVAHRERKSISVENTFSTDIVYGPELLTELRQLVFDLGKRIRKTSPVSGKTMTLKVKFYDFQQITRSITHPHYYQSLENILTHADDKLKSVCLREFPGKAIRLLGIGISQLNRHEGEYHDNRQLDFFDFFESSETETLN